MTGARSLVATGPYLLLVGATLAAFVLTEDAADSRLAATLVILIASFKIHLVVRHFMEVRWAVRPWRMILEAWIAVVTAMILAGYWLPLL